MSVVCQYTLRLMIGHVTCMEHYNVCVSTWLAVRVLRLKTHRVEIVTSFLPENRHGQ